MPHEPWPSKRTCAYLSPSVHSFNCRQGLFEADHHRIGTGKRNDCQSPRTQSVFAWRRGDDHPTFVRRPCRRVATQKRSALC
jgi:hypothetical protein